MMRILWSHVPPQYRWQLSLLLLLVGVTAVMEALTIAASIPFVSLLTGSTSETMPKAAREWLNSFGDPLIGAALILTCAVASLAALRLALLWRQQRFAMAFGLDLSRRVFSRLLRQPYSAYLDQNSSDLLGGMEKSERMIQAVLLPVLQGVVALIMAIFVVAALVVINPMAALFAGLAGGGSYTAVRLITEQRLREGSRETAAAIAARNRTVREALGGIRDVLIEGSQPLHEARYVEFNVRSRRALAVSAFISQAPRYAIEALGVGVIALLALILSRGAGGFTAAAPVLGAFALGAQRLLPLLQQAWLGYSQFSSQRQSVADVYDLLKLPVVDESSSTKPLSFSSSVVFDQVGFAYGADCPVLVDFGCEITRGECVGIVGESGSGKSTLADLLMGLIEPQTGGIYVDGEQLNGRRRRSWQANIGHVPQSVYLFDDTIAANVALLVGSAQVNRAALQEAARVAHLDSFIESLPAGWETRVGERGVRLSGGQRQRIGIARALYRQRPVLILDEATNALDEATEAGILEKLSSISPRLTLFIIGHRSSALAKCDQLIRLRRVPSAPP